MIGDHREQRIEEIIRRVTGGYRRQVQVDLQEYPRPQLDLTEEGGDA